MLDRSSGGLRVSIDQQFKPGTMVNVRPTKAHSSFPWIEVDVQLPARARQLQHRLSVHP